ncbi:transmembrane protein 98-like [Acanthaster planci]|uniref:Transmembrane protein 98 n=1 Tax=Acanthaster planci TaxID=133434 RepID=A0A8B7XI27_ACAPL|nr:transmembrane protein 98-like [Acanthaster planci]XP_022079773.1 transmembrane protein 98-like [Acanthaster planci]XP_022079774.1 transmembrane protein 98-like [Acanthaster planci]
MEIIVAVAIGILCFLFVASLGVLVVICRHRYCRILDLTLKEKVNHGSRTSTVTLVSHAELPNEDFEVELNDVCWHNAHLEELLDDDAKWVDDASGLIPHCIGILKTCHHLTEKLVAMTMGNPMSVKTPESLSEIVTVAKRISPRVDDVVRSMYPPLDPKLIEARSAALLLSVNHLVLVTKQACRLPPTVQWIDSSLGEMEEHLQAMREIALAGEMDSGAGSLSSGTEGSHHPMLGEEFRSSFKGQLSAPKSGPPV